MARGTTQERGSDSPPVRVPAPDPHEVMLIQGPVPELHAALVFLLAAVACSVPR